LLKGDVCVIETMKFNEIESEVSKIVKILVDMSPVEFDQPYFW
jgi:biotin carboxyl carrier protein